MYTLLPEEINRAAGMDALVVEYRPTGSMPAERD